jgi:hypothetical protein
MVNVTNHTSPSEFTVPNNKRWIVSCIDVYWGGGIAPPSTQVGIAGVLTWWIAQPAFTSTPDPVETTESQSWHWEGHQVLYPGEALMVSSNGVGVDVCVSGYELDEPA